MARSYRHIQQYEKEMLELKAKGLTVREIGEKFGLSYEQARGFFKRHNRKERKIAALGRTQRSRHLKWKMSLCGIFSRLQEGSETGSKVQSYLPSQGQIQHQ